MQIDRCWFFENILLKKKNKLNKIKIIFCTKSIIKVKK